MTTIEEVPVTGTVYGLVDPRTNQIRYVGETIRPLAERLTAHYGKSAAPRLRQWLVELREAGLKPRIVPLREDIPEKHLLTAEREEATQICAAGGRLLNTYLTRDGYRLHKRRQEEVRAEAQRVAWQELAKAAITTFGGPLAPGELPGLELPGIVWHFMAADADDHSDCLVLGPQGTAWPPPDRRDPDHTARFAERELVRAARHAAGGGADDGDPCHWRHWVAGAMTMRWHSHADLFRYLRLLAWYTVAVDPWRHLADLAGMPRDDASFTEWAGRDADTRSALAFLSACAPGVLSGRLQQYERRDYYGGPGRLLGVAASAYSGVTPRDAIGPQVSGILTALAHDHQLTGPMAQLFWRLDPNALDTAYGPDIATGLDSHAGLPSGTSAQVLRALVQQAPAIGTPRIKLAADRSAQVFPTVALPYCSGWDGIPAPGARALAASLVRGALAAPVHCTADEFLAQLRRVWAASPRPLPPPGPVTIAPRRRMWSGREQLHTGRLGLGDVGDQRLA
jgi:hypothetical protein